VTTEPSPYDRMGGAAGVRALVQRFYDLMAERADARDILRMHPENLASSREKLYEFLSGWLGGPQLYMERRGHPRLRMRHMPFAIDDAAARAWMACMTQALAEAPGDELVKTMLLGAFQRMADHLRNVGDQQRPEDPTR
jgi:hemoglobin